MLSIFITKYKLPLAIIATIILNSCSHQENHAPKPRGYYRINFNQKEYVPFNNVKQCTFSFLIPTYSTITPDTSTFAEPCWINVEYPKYNGKLHISYWKTTSKKKLIELAEDSRKMVFKHTIRASEINEIQIKNSKNETYGFLYEIEGNAASPIQFYISNNKNQFLRGALYFHSRPDIDFIKPVIDYIRLDIDKLINSFQWKQKFIQ